MFWWIAALGCSGGGDFLDDRLSCDYNVFKWYDTPTMSAVESDKDGKFKYDPPGSQTDKRKGKYNLNNGNLSWTTTYKDGYFQTTTDVDGYGTIYENGNLDLLYKATTVDDWGDSATERVRITREGCEELRTSWEFDADLDAEALPADDAIAQAWSATIVSKEEVQLHYESPDSDATLVRDTSLFADGTSEGTYSYVDGSETTHATIDGYADGTAAWFSESHYAAPTINYYVTREQTQRFGGDYEVIVTGIYENSDEPFVRYEYIQSYEGINGDRPIERTGTYHQPGSNGEWFTCDYYEDEDDCTISCPDYDSNC